MPDWKWSDAERKLAQRVYEHARLAELDDTLAEFKRLAAAAPSVDEMWPLEEYLRTRRRALDEKYQFRYSRLPWLFAQLVREGRVDPAELAGLSHEKLGEILRMASRQVQSGVA